MLNQVVDNVTNLV